MIGDLERREFELPPAETDAPLDQLVELAARACGASRAVLALAGDGAWLVPAAFGGTSLEPSAEACCAQAAHRAETTESDRGPGSLPVAAAPVGTAEGGVLGALAVWGLAAPSLLPGQRRALELAASLAGATLGARRTAFRERASHLATRRELERADRLATVGKLAAGIAHEVGTPLAVVSGRARQLAAGSVPPEQVSQAARTVAEQADRIAGIIRQLLDFARRREPRPGRFDIRTLVRQSVALVEQAALRRKVRLEFADPPAARIVQFDGSQMMQVLTNLLMNAIQATAEGGKVSVAVQERDLTPPAATGLEPGRYVEVRITDAGVGILAQDLLRVFDPFFTTKDTGEGTGLGLSVAQGIVRDHAGWIEVESQRGQGSTFSVHLPG